MAKLDKAQLLYLQRKLDKEWLNSSFMKAIWSYKPDNMDTGTFLDIVFGALHRNIEFYECVKPITLYGACWDGNTLRVESGRRDQIQRFKAGQFACIRTDAREPIVTIQGKWGCVNVSEERWTNEYKSSFIKSRHRDQKS